MRSNVHAQRARNRSYVFRLQFESDPFLTSRGRRSGNGRSYKPGDNVPQSGIYEAVHANRHRAPHDVVMIAKDLFPLCEVCDESVRFRLLRAAPYIFEDEDFAEER